MNGDPTRAREVDLGRPLTGVAGGPQQLRLLVCFGDRAVGEMVLPVPAAGLSGPEIGAAVAARYGALERRPRDDRQPRAVAVPFGAAGRRQRDDRQPRSRSRGSTWSE